MLPLSTIHHARPRHDGTLSHYAAIRCIVLVCRGSPSDEDARSSNSSLPADFRNHGPPGGRRRAAAPELGVATGLVDSRVRPRAESATRERRGLGRRMPGREARLGVPPSMGSPVRGVIQSYPTASWDSRHGRYPRGSDMRAGLPQNGLCPVVREPPAAAACTFAVEYHHPTYAADTQE